MNRRTLIKYGLASIAAALPVPALAYPDRPIKLIVPFSPGGATDVVGRLWADRMKPQFGTIVVENKGGGGIIGATEVARAQPDGHKPMISFGFEPVLDSGPDAAQRMVANELKRWTPIIKATGFTQ